MKANVNAPPKSREILRHQGRSLQVLARRAGVSREELEAFTIRDLGVAYERAREQTKLVTDAFGSFAGLTLADFDASPASERPTDFWTYTAQRERITHLIAVREISKHAAHLPINWPFLSKLAIRHSMPTPQPDPKRLEEFLWRIPAAYVFDHEFNAYVEWGDPASLPCVFYDTLLINSISELCLLGSVFWESNAPNDARDEYPEEYAQTVAEFADLIVDRLLGTKLLTHFDLPRERNARTFLGRLGTEYSAHLFVSAHELAHLLLGHADRRAGPELEHEADCFATLVVGASSWINREFGIFAALALLDVVEGNRGVSPTHPFLLDRMALVVQQTRAARSNVDWNYVGNFYKRILDDSLMARIRRRLFEGRRRADHGSRRAR